MSKGNQTGQDQPKSKKSAAAQVNPPIRKIFTKKEIELPVELIILTDIVMAFHMLHKEHNKYQNPRYTSAEDLYVILNTHTYP